ncbi:MAG: tetratricopeptide repeat protein [Bryobacteraceae bacterium]
MAAIKLLLSYYVRPLDAASKTLDHGRFWIAVLLAGAVAVLLIAPGRVVRHAPAPEDAAPPLAETLGGALGLAPGRSLGELLFLAAVFTPLAILALARWGSLGPARFILRRDYSGATTCLMMAWAAAHLPFAIAWSAIGARGGVNPALAPALKGAGLAYFLVLAACVLRSVPGGSFSSALVTSISGAVVCAAGGIVSAAMGFGMFYIASPCILYWLYLRFGSSVQGLGEGLSHQQSFRRHLEATTLNPRDADAHYQLGLLYQQRRSAGDAESRFRKAVEIEPDDADYLLALGQLLRERNRPQEALPFLDRSVSINPKAGNGEVLRELGAVHLALGNHDEALRRLEPYVQRREYDPEGLVFYGQALGAAGRVADARKAFENAIEAVATAPSYRTGQVRKWRDRAKEGLRRLPS